MNCYNITLSIEKKAVMNYQTPQLSLIGAAQSLVLGSCQQATSLKFVDSPGAPQSRGKADW